MFNTFPAFRELRDGKVASVREMRVSTLRIFLRATITMALIYSLYSSIIYALSWITSLAFVTALLATSFVVVACHVLFIAGPHRRWVAPCYLAVIVAGILIGETEPQGFYLGESVIYMAIPIVIAPAICPPPSAFVLWAAFTGGATAYGLSQNQGTQVNFYAFVSLFFVSLIVYIINARSEAVVRRTLADKSVLNQAMDVVIEHERGAIRGYQANGRSRQDTRVNQGN